MLALREEATTEPVPLVPTLDTLDGVRKAGPRACLALAVRMAVEGQVLFREQFFKSGRKTSDEQTIAIPCYDLSSSSAHTNLS